MKSHLFDKTQFYSLSPQQWRNRANPCFSSKAAKWRTLTRKRARSRAKLSWKKWEIMPWRATLMRVETRTVWAPTAQRNRPNRLSKPPGKSRGGEARNGKSWRVWKTGRSLKASPIFLTGFCIRRGNGL